MNKLGVNELRDLFINFYKSKEHLHYDGHSLVPDKDEKTLLLINSGMAPLKKFFSGEQTPPSKRMATVQKCIRTADLENVGKTSRHATFFEMLGSFSFGDYFKKESIEWGYEFIKDVLKMPMDKIWVTVYKEDDEAYGIWANDIGFPKNKIVRLDKDDNFWEIGLGPCGPCSEIYFDRGEEYGCASKDCKPGCSCDRYIEFWNHVFTEFDHKQDGSYSKLKNKNIDTGLGLERLSAIVQGVETIFEIDTMKNIINKIEEASNATYDPKGTKDSDASIRIITDHIRASVFMIADGILPGSDERNYVLRKIIRRAILHTKKLNIKDGFLSELAETVIKLNEGAYKELTEKKEKIKEVLILEEDKFEKTIQGGLKILEKECASLKENSTLPAELSFKLYDTYGFPLDLTKEILSEKNISIDETGFNELIKEQKIRSSKNSSIESGWEVNSFGSMNLMPTVFIGYENGKTNAKIVAFENVSNDCYAVFDKTVFYATMGGQMCDIGIVKIDNKTYDIIDVKKEKDIYIHKIRDCNLTDNSNVELEINQMRRNLITSNHTAVHLLHFALRKVLGKEVHQTGSFVNDEILRLDFSYDKKLSDEEIYEIESLVNYWISLNIDTDIKEMSLEEASKLDAMALFEDKYGDKVRVVSIIKDEENKPVKSIEFCGGTHVNNTGMIGAFNIILESSISAGNRRIEAITSTNVSKYSRDHIDVLNILSKNFKVPFEGIVQKVESLQANNNELKKKLKTISSGSDNGGLNPEKIGNINVFKNIFEDFSVKEVQTISDAYTKNQSICLFLVKSKKTILSISISNDLISDKVDASILSKLVAEKFNTGGGGKKNIAQVGLNNEEDYKIACEIVEKKLLDI